MRVCPKFFLLILIAFAAIFFIWPNMVLSVGQVTLISYPGQAQIGEEFTVYFKVDGFEADTDYYMKIRIGQGSSLGSGETFNSITSTWLYDTSGWDNFPTFGTNSKGSASAQLKSRAKSSAQLGDNILLVRVRKIGGSTNYDSDQELITLSAAPTSTPTPEPENTPTPTPTPESTPTPTTKPSPTPTKKPTPTKTPTPTPPGKILGEEATPEAEPTDLETSPESTPSSNLQSFLPFIFIGSGILFLAIAGGSVLLPNLKKKYNRRQQKLPPLENL